MSNYHTNALQNADVFTVMGSIYAEVARYDSAISSGDTAGAAQAAARATELVNFSDQLKQINPAQKQEIQKFNELFTERAKKSQKSQLDNYLMPFAMAARMRQLA